MVDVLDVMLGPIVMCTSTLVSLSASFANSSPFHLYVNTALMLPAINAIMTINHIGIFIITMSVNSIITHSVIIKRIFTSYILVENPPRTRLTLSQIFALVIAFSYNNALPATFILSGLTGAQ